MVCQRCCVYGLFCSGFQDSLRSDPKHCTCSPTRTHFVFLPSTCYLSLAMVIATISSNKCIGKYILTQHLNKSRFYAALINQKCILLIQLFLFIFAVFTHARTHTENTSQCVSCLKLYEQRKIIYIFSLLIVMVWF